jgi:callose synthase
MLARMLLMTNSLGLLNYHMSTEVHFVFQILLAIDLALDCKDTQADLWNRICRDEYMAYAVQECYFSIEKILYSLVDGEGRLWYRSPCLIVVFESLCFQFKLNQILNRFCMPCINIYCNIDYLFFCFFGNLLYDRVERIFREINNSISEGSLVITLSLKKLPVVLSRFTALTGLLVYVLLTMCIIELA